MSSEESLASTNGLWLSSNLQKQRPADVTAFLNIDILSLRSLRLFPHGFGMVEGTVEVQ